MIDPDEIEFDGHGAGTDVDPGAGTGVGGRDESGSDRAPGVGGTGIVTIGDSRVVYRRAGSEGPPVVLLHGGGVDDSTLSWRHAIEALGDDYRVYAPDWPGYGDSEDGTGFDHSIDGYVETLEAFLDELGLERVSLVGISMGGGVSIGFSLANPDRVDRLVLVDSYGLGDWLPRGKLWKTAAHLPGANSLGWAAMSTSDGTARLALGAVVSDAEAIADDFVRDFRSRASAPGAGRAFEEFQRNEISPSGRVRTDFTDELPSLSVPTLLVHGIDDPLVPVEWSKRASTLMPEAELVVLRKCGHWVPRERPTEFTDVVRSYLSGNEPAYR
ncbi:alpha/beta fold hydrolase [Natrialbaceae archaeon GCM10025810]|uniref:alpha/beta fold hydrolase n=1 Tax=Halovalidus salilacus TaxID=3075124 RepID=UPI0036086C6C